MSNIRIKQIVPANGNPRDIDGGCLTSHVPPFEFMNATLPLIGGGERRRKPRDIGKMTDLYVVSEEKLVKHTACIVFSAALYRIFISDNRYYTTYNLHIFLGSLF